MTFSQKIFSIIAACCLVVVIIYLVKKGKLKEEYSWMWLLTGFGVVVIVLWYDILLFITRLIGAVLPTTTLFIFGFLFLIFLSLHYSIKISKLTYQVKTLAQKISFLEAEREQGPIPHQKISEIQF